MASISLNKWLGIPYSAWIYLDYSEADSLTGSGAKAFLAGLAALIASPWAAIAIGAIEIQAQYIHDMNDKSNGNGVKLLFPLPIGPTITCVHIRTSNPKPRDPAPPFHPVLQVGQVLKAGEELVADTGLFSVCMQADGNLVLYYNPTGHAMWATGTYGKPVNRCQLQPDGNFVLYDAANKPYWATGTNGKPVNRCQIQPDGNFVLYDAANKPYWATHTQGKT